MKKKNNYKYVLIVLVYRNYADLEEFVQSCQMIPNHKIVVVNAFYDQQTKECVQNICSQYNCDFLNIENKGYSWGNNYGIKFVSNNYSFDWIIISNPDIVIEEFSEELLAKEAKDIIAPRIITIAGKHQNPMKVRRSKLSEKLIYKGFKKQKKWSIYLGVLIHKVWRFMFLLFNSKKNKRIYCAHGSFVLISNSALEKLEHKPYDENMFLFSEESVLAVKAEKKNIKIFYDPNIRVKHKEDGSMSLAKVNVFGELAKSNIYFYEKYCAKD